MKKVNQVIEFVCDNAQFYPNNPNHLKYMVKLNGRGIGASDTDELVTKVCNKLNIKK